MRTLLLLVLLTSLVTIFALPAAAAELAGVTLADSVQVGDQSLVLNGLGLRKKFIVKVYVGGLYLPAKESDPEKILAADEAHQMVMHFVYDVDKEALCDAWDDCLEANSPGASAELKQGFVELCSYMEDVESGERMTFTYLPEQGTEVRVQDMVKGTPSGQPFADALLACWVGPKPPSEDFKRGLLGR